MFKKLNFKFNDDVIRKCKSLLKTIDFCKPVLEFDKLLGEKDYITEENKECMNYYMDRRCNYILKDFPYKAIINHLPQKILDVEIPEVRWLMFDKGELCRGYQAPPHKDDPDFRKCNLNFYIQVNDEETIFYNAKRPGVWGYSGEMYMPEWLEKYDSFVAKAEDNYLLDVLQIHSIENIFKPRILISFNFMSPYSELVKLID